MSSICSMFKQSTERNSIVQTFESYYIFQAMVTSSCWSHLSVYYSINFKMNGKTDKCQKPSVLFHVICNLSSVTHPPFAVLLLWDLYLGPQQPPQSLPALLLLLQPAAWLSALLLLPEKKKNTISRNNWNPLYSCKCPGFSGFLYSLQLTSHTFCLPVASILGRKWKIFSPMQQSFKLFPPSSVLL